MTPSNDDLQRQISELKNDLETLKNHRYSIDTDIDGMFEVVSVVPINSPHTMYDQIKIYVNGTTYRLYWYDWNAHAWHYINATA